MIRSWVPKANALAVALTVVLAVGYMATSSHIAVAGPETATCANVIDRRYCPSPGTSRRMGVIGSCHNSSTWFDPGTFGGTVAHHSCCIYEEELNICVAPNGSESDGGTAEYFREMLNFPSDCSTASYYNTPYGIRGNCMQQLE